MINFILPAPKSSVLSWKAFLGCYWLQPWMSVSSTNVWAQYVASGSNPSAKMSIPLTFICSLILDNNKGVYYFREAIGTSFPSLLVYSYHWIEFNLLKLAFKSLPLELTSYSCSSAACLDVLFISFFQFYEYLLSVLPLHNQVSS